MNKIAIIIDTNIFGQPSEYNFNDIRISTFCDCEGELGMGAPEGKPVKVLRRAK